MKKDTHPIQATPDQETAIALYIACIRIRWSSLRWHTYGRAREWLEERYRPYRYPYIRGIMHGTKGHDLAPDTRIYHLRRINKMLKGEVETLRNKMLRSTAT